MSRRLACTQGNGGSGDAGDMISRPYSKLVGARADGGIDAIALTTWGGDMLQ